jgi:hypothetical protein
VFFYRTNNGNSTVVPSDFAVILVGRNPIFLNSFGKSIVVVPSLANAIVDHTIEPPVNHYL